MKKSVNKTNAKFKVMSPAQKRVAIARDVLEQIKLQKFIIERGNFAIVRNGIYPDPEVFDKKYLRSKEVIACDVCAIGACIISGIRLFNKVTFGEKYISPEESWNLVREFFSPQQAVLIENAFEKGGGAYNCDWSEDEKLPDVDTGTAEEFGEQHDDDTERAVAIFENIITNKGTFKP